MPTLLQLVLLSFGTIALVRQPQLPVVQLCEPESTSQAEATEPDGPDTPGAMPASVCQPTIYRCTGSEASTQAQACANAQACAIDAGACWYQPYCLPSDCVKILTSPVKYQCSVPYKLE